MPLTDESLTSVRPLGYLRDGSRKSVGAGSQESL